MARPRRPFGEDRARVLFAETADEVLARGYEGASLNAILERSGVAKSSFYHYFDDKAGLFDALVREYGAAFDAEIGVDVPMLAPRGPEVSIDALAARLVAAAKKDPRTLVLGRILAVPDVPRTPAVAGFTLSLMHRMLRALLLWRGRGEVSAVLPLRLQFLSLLAVVRVADQWVLAQGVTEESAAQAAALIHGVLRVDAARR
ncbi:TetR/AcrR family transcriptional regulator [Microbacterium sp.]|uniref:TetR/AcrR family transcriptional regulator n=1 Tax=Microbacterium sp. TaxID=51671 RepID=UPI0033418AB2